MKRRLRVPPDMRARLETARLDLLALFRALDKLSLSPDDIPQGQIHELFELDADFAEALFVLDKPPPGLHTEAMVRDTLTSLGTLQEARENFLSLLPESSLQPLAALENDIRGALTPQDAYLGIPGRDPQCR